MYKVDEVKKTTKGCSNLFNNNSDNKNKSESASNLDDEDDTEVKRASVPL